MIEYVRGASDDRATISARSELAIGVTTRAITVSLGEWPPDAPDPGGPLGLASAPAVITQDPDLAQIIEAGARRAGRGSRVERFAAAPDLGVQLLMTPPEPPGVMVITGGGVELRLVRVLGGRPIAVVPIDGGAAAIEALLEPVDIDVHIPIPTGVDAVRDAVRACVAPLHLETLHHILEVDPGPAFDELGLDVDGESLSRLAAGAAGVLAGRIAAGNARWRRDLDG